MKKYGLGLGIVSMIIGACFFFLVGILISGAWWLFGVPFFVLGLIAIVLSDKLNNGKQKRANEKKVREENLQTTKQNLYEQLDREKQARNDMLRNIHSNND